MLKVLLTVFLLASVGLAQSSSDGSFSVRHATKAKFSLSSAQMREAETLYRTACEVVQRNFHGGTRELHPRFTVVIGADSNEVRGSMVQDNDVHVNAEIWMKKWDPMMFAQGVVILAFDKLLTADVIMQLGERTVSLSDATVDVAKLK